MKQLIWILLAFSMTMCGKDAGLVPSEEKLIAEKPNLHKNTVGEENRSYVFDFEEQRIFAFPVVENNITLLFGFKYRDFCQGDFSNIDVFSFLQVLKNEDDNFPRIHELSKGYDVTLEIWPFADETYGADCQIYFDNDPIFSGEVDVLFTDNDLTPFDEDANVNSYGFVAKGDGIHAVFRAQWDGLNDESYRTIHCKVRLK